MNDKKTELKRIVIFLALVFVIFWIPAFLLNLFFGDVHWSRDGHLPAFMLIFSLIPAAANYMTRKITGEGMSGNYLHLNLKGNMKYYAAAMFLPCLTGLLLGIIMTIMSVKGRWDIPWPDKLGELLYAFIAGLAGMYAALGEEIGWRAYLAPKAENIMGKKAGAVFSGAMWGIWYLPMVLSGYDLGVGNEAVVWGIISVLLFCIGLNMVLIWLTERTGTVYPAAIMRSVVRCGGISAIYMIINGAAHSPAELIGCGVIQLLMGICFIMQTGDTQQKKEKTE